MRGPALAVFGLLSAVAILNASDSRAAQGAAPDEAPDVLEDIGSAELGPVDWGFGPGVRPGGLQHYLRSATAFTRDAGQAALAAGDAHIKGSFGAPIPWQIVAIHTALIPDGRVISFGSTVEGKDGATLYYDIWDPALGTGPTSHLLLPNTTNTDIFCGGQSVLPVSGEVAIFGGDAGLRGLRHLSNNRLTVFRPTRNDVVDRNPMFLKRWYPTAIAMPDGRLLVLGGRLDRVDQPPAITPEILSTAGAWTLLTGASNLPAFGGIDLNWYYPRAFVTPTSSALLVGHDGKLFTLDVAGLGRTTQLGLTIERGSTTLPAVMYAPGKILTLRKLRKAVILDTNGAAPTATETGLVPTGRYYGSATVLPNGEVLVTGGSVKSMQLQYAVYDAAIWNPATGAWRTGATAQKARFYHSTALLMPDATVLVAGGGAPGPVTNLNAEIYSPPYLFKKDGSGQLAPRPTITSAPTSIATSSSFTMSVGAGQSIRKVALVRTGSSTHAFNADQRYLSLPFTQSGTTLSVGLTNERRAIPGFYLLFVLDADGVPSIARIVRVPIPT